MSRQGAVTSATPLARRLAVSERLLDEVATLLPPTGGAHPIEHGEPAWGAPSDPDRVCLELAVAASLQSLSQCRLTSLRDFLALPARAVPTATDPPE